MNKIDLDPEEDANIFVDNKGNTVVQFIENGQIINLKLDEGQAENIAGDLVEIVCEYPVQHNMDFDEGPTCQCGSPSKFETGWCGECNLKPFIFERLYKSNHENAGD